MIVDCSDINKARKEILKLEKQGKEIAVVAKDPDFNRKVLEIKGVNVLLSPELHERKDKLKERDSGLNEVLCKIAAKKKIKIGIVLSKITGLEKKEKAKVLARIRQNAFLCRKAFLKMFIYDADKFSDNELRSLMRILGLLS